MKFTNSMPSRLAINTNKLFCLLVYITVLFTSFTFSADASEQQAIQQALTNAKLASKRGNLQTAKGILLDLLKLHPNALRARAELAMLQYRLKEWQAAEDNLGILLNVPSLPVKVRQNLHRLDASIKAKKQVHKVSEPTTKHRLNGVVQVSMGNDNNMALGTVNDIFLDDVYEADVIDTYPNPHFDIYDPNLDDDLFYGENLDNESYLFNHYCEESVSLDEPCQVIDDLILASGETATSYLTDGFINQAGEFIPYSSIDYDGASDPEFNEGLAYNTNDSFWQQNLKVRHQFLDKSKKLQWQNNIQATVESAFNLHEFDKKRVRIDSHLIKSLNEHWFISGQVYYSRLKQGEDKLQIYKGIQPELNYLTGVGKFALRWDWVDKRYTIDYFVDQSSIFTSKTLSWSQLFLSQQLMLTASVRFSKNDATGEYSDYRTNNYAVSALYHFANHWEFQLSLNTTKFDFPYKPSININNIKSSLSYAISDDWKAFVSAEYNEINNDFMHETTKRGTYQIGLGWYF